MKSRPHAGKCRARMYEELKKTEAGRKWMAEAENRINEYLEEKVKGYHEGKDKKEREDAETAKSEAEQVARGNATQKEQSKIKRETQVGTGEADRDKREPEGKQRKVSTPLVETERATTTEASSSSQGPRQPRDITLAGNVTRGPAPTVDARSAPIEAAESHNRDPVEADPDEGDEGEGPVEMQRICSICVGHGAADKIGEVKRRNTKKILKQWWRSIVQEMRWASVSST